jgi:hypothetical protein
MYKSGRTLSVRQSDFNQLTFCSYLWIDSLCIIQDSKEDWANECSHMAGVYTNSYLTIAAVSCKDSLEGFIEADPTYTNIQCKLTAISGAPGHFLFIRPYHGFEYWHVRNSLRTNCVPLTSMYEQVHITISSTKDTEDVESVHQNGLLIGQVKHQRFSVYSHAFFFKLLSALFNIHMPSTIH